MPATDGTLGYDLIVAFVRAAADQGVKPPDRAGGGRTYKRRGRFVKRYTQHPEWRVWTFSAVAGPLLVTAGGELVREAAGHGATVFGPDVLREQVVAGSRGDPSYLGQLVASVHENLERHGVDWPATAPPLPPRATR